LSPVSSALSLNRTGASLALSGYLGTKRAGSSVKLLTLGQDKLGVLLAATEHRRSEPRRLARPEPHLLAA